MFRTISLLRRTLPQTLTASSSFSSSNQHFVSPIHRISSDYLQSKPPPLSFHSSPLSSRQRNANPDKDCGYSDSSEPKGPPKLFVVQPRVRPDAVLNSKLSEALNLAQSLEEQQRDGDCGFESSNKEVPPHVIVQNPASRATKKHADKYFGQGTVDTVKCHLNALKDDLDAVFVNAVLTAGQQRNLERAWGMPVLDRVGLIIEIFNAHANTKEAKLQAELAALMYKKTRLVRIRAADGRFTFGAGGEAEVVSARGRGSGGQGFISGAGETELQLQRRRILERRNRLLTEIEEVRRTRALQRASRKRRGGTEGQGLATVAIVGYTNAGKSTLVSTLSESDLYSDDRLFATVDPQLKNVVLPSGKKVLLSDTVGFISDLPVQLVEAFHATLEEVTEAELLVHVIDSSALNVEDQRSSVLQVLQQIGVSDAKLQNMIEVWNKVDLRKEEDKDKFVEDGEIDEEEFEEGEQEFKEYVELSSEEALKEDDQEDDREDGLLKEKNTVSVNQGDNIFLEEWETGDEDEPESNYEGLNSSSMGDKQSEYLPSLTKRDSHLELLNVQRLETSAVTGVGLQELLNAIDNKLDTQGVVESRNDDFFNRKWRPPQAANSGAH
ncbi:hypothetical protein MKW98_032108 [Papaver atlanticum]|uniref:Hflx-type G domain-containing protein n=1 Tax=Papaver atlanticum TaxID=357466 RepID=A0AAD4SFB6_9MAGN|nr:hypothetical protein MKW98_032108 [Papaver atlanticum]